MPAFACNSYFARQDKLKHLERKILSIERKILSIEKTNGSKYN